ncbi:MAG: DUF3267 domain-containing protein [Candidatus Dormibacteraeota bacterium]|nr:DUF3267 domain-containing protein [Candidatus Dormibacteraeota bacterium]
MVEPARRWRELWSFQIRSDVAGAITLASLMLGAASIVALGALLLHLHPDVPIRPLAFGLAILTVVIAHEGIHAVVFAAFGGRPRVGATVKGWTPLVYIHCAGQTFSRNRFLVVGLAPLLVLDLLGLVLLVPAGTADFAFWLVVMNTAGAAGDLWMAALILQVPSWVQFRDAGVGISALAPADHGDQAESVRTPLGLKVPGAQWVLGWLGLTVLAAAALETAVVLLGLARRVSVIGVGPLVLARSHSPAPGHHGPGVELNLGALLLAAAVLGALVVLALGWISRVRAGRETRPQDGPTYPSVLTTVARGQPADPTDSDQQSAWEKS